MRRILRNIPINRKLLLISMIINTIVLMIVFAGVVVIESRSFKRSMVRDLGTFASVIGHYCGASLVFQDRADAKETLDSLSSKNSIISAFLYTSGGVVLAGYTREGDSRGKPPAMPGREFDRFDKGSLVLYRDILLNDEKIGGLYVESDLEGLQDILNRNMVMLGVLLVASFLVVYVLSDLLQRFITVPMAALSRAARKISKEKDYRVRVKKHGEDELGALFDAFNEMLDEILKRDNELVAAMQRTESAKQKSEKLLESMEKINKALEREVRERKSIEQELLQHKNTLEDLVDKRTRQLREANVHLRQEIEEKRLAEESIRRALDEKVILLHEIHHRVKNNLQIVASLLEMSKNRVRSREASDQLSEAHAKIFTMAIIHNQLYQNDRFDQVNMERHVRELYSHLSNLYSKNRQITPRIEVSNLRLPITQAIPCALILNELLSNAFKYAYDGRPDGMIAISMQRYPDKKMHMEIRDDGSGIPEHIDIEKTNSLGLKLVRNLVTRQLNGELHIGRDKGTVVHISFTVAE